MKRAHLDQSCHVNLKNKAGIQASYIVALRIAQQKKPHNIGEKLILPSAKIFFGAQLGMVLKRNLALCLCQTTEFEKNI